MCGSRSLKNHKLFDGVKQAVEEAAKILSATISREADRWFVSITVEIPDESKPSKQIPKSIVVGVDLGVSAMATLSTGEKIPGPKPHSALLCRLKQCSKALSRKIKGSKNSAKAKIKLARMHARISNIRLDAIHKFTSELVSRFHEICVENLNIRGMVKQRRFARSVFDMGFYEIRRQLEYKAVQSEVRLHVAGRFFPSSKTCSKCGHVLADLPLSVRIWDCAGCGTIHDRDLNAASNLAAYAVSSTVKACGGSSSGQTDIPYCETARKKQEVNVNIYP